jgi:hypothetical protein
MSDKKTLAKRIRKFLDTYAKKDAEGAEWNSPDAYELERCIRELETGVILKAPFSEWGSGGYYPYTSKEGQKEHDEILKEIKKL